MRRAYFQGIRAHWPESAVFALASFLVWVLAPLCIALAPIARFGPEPLRSYVIAVIDPHALRPDFDLGPMLCFQLVAWAMLIFVTLVWGRLLVMKYVLWQTRGERCDSLTLLALGSVLQADEMARYLTDPRRGEDHPGSAHRLR